MSIFRETFHKNIKSSLKHRQDAMVTRTTNNIQYLNSRNSWIKMQSSVNVNGTADLAKSYVLQGGTLNKGSKLRSGLGSTGDEAYSTKSPGGLDHRLGIRPMPGITSIDIKSKSAYGSLREVTVNFQCWDIHQLEDLELLYMRPGYTVLIEWGWLPYLDVSGGYQANFTDFYDILNKGTTERTKIFKELYETSVKHGGNYDAMFGYIKNYQWSAREDGGYDCQTTVISTGEIIESLKINYVKPNLADYGLYNTGSIGSGSLNELFASQGNTPSTKFADHYEKNILAGTWAELYYKIKDPSATVQSSTTLDGSDYAIVKMPGLLGQGDATSVIDPGSDIQGYITLKSVFEILNKFIIGKDSSGEPLITLSTSHNKYDGSSVTGSDLFCIAHPLQISTDPSVCVIKNTVWEDAMSNIVVSSASTKTTLQSQANTIASELVEASDDAIKTGVRQDAFKAAIAKINTPALYQLVDDLFKGGTLVSKAGTKFNTYSSNGLAGLIEEQFVKESTSLSPVGFTNSRGEASGVDYGLIGLYYIWEMQQSLKQYGLILEATINNPNNISGAPKNLTEATTGVTPSKWFENLPKLTERVKTGTFTVYIDQEFINDYTVGTVTITAPPSSPPAISIIFSADDAKAMVSEINKALKKEYFYKSDPYSEIGIIGNIYINLNFLYKLSTSGQLESQDSKEKQEINVYNYAKNIISGVNNVLGNVANLEMHVDPIDSIGRAIDVNYTDPDKTTKSNLFELQVQNLKSVVRSYTLESKIFPNQSAIIAIGSQAKGGQLGMQNNTMVDFNKSITDRIIPKKADGDTANSQNSKSPSVANSLASIITLYALCHLSPRDTSAYPDAVSKCKNALRDIIAYFQALTDSSGSNRNIIPTKFSFEMDGIGGLVIGQLFTINSGVLPKGYKGGANGIGSELAQTITGISHKIGNSDWTTTIDALNVILDKKAGDFKNVDLKGIITAIVQLAIARANSVAPAPFGGTPPGGTPPPGGIPPTGVKGNATAMKLAGDTLFDKIGGEKSKCAVYTYTLAQNYTNALKGDQIYASLIHNKGNAGDISYHNNLIALGYTKTPLGVLTKADLQKQIDSISSIGTIINYKSTVIPNPRRDSTTANCADENYVYCYGHTQIYTGGVLNSSGKSNWASSFGNNYNTSQVYANKYSSIDSWEAYLFTL